MPSAHAPAADLIGGIDLAWGKTRRVETKNGPRTVREAPANERFWELWRNTKEACKIAGLSVRKVDLAWIVTHWSQPAVRAIQPIAARAIQRTPSRPLSPPILLDPTLAVPVPEGRALLGYQFDDVRMMASMRTVLLASEQGTGKTVEIAALANAIGARSMLVVAPARLLGNWRDELQAWRVNAAPPTVISTANSHLVGEPCASIVSYDTAARPEVIERIMAASPFDLVVFDEAHAFGNHESLRTMALIGGDGLMASMRVMATGTPFKNRPIELWPLLRWLDPERWPDRHDYGLRYCRGRIVDGVWDYSGATNLEELSTILRGTVMIRRTKAEVLPDLPPKRHDLIVVQPTLEQRDMITREQDVRRFGTVSIDAISDSMAAVEIDGDENLSRLRAELALSKANAIGRHVDTLIARGEKVVLFVHHAPLVTALAARWGERSVRIVGGQTPKQTEASVRSFQAGNAEVAICSIRAAGAGLTLTAARHVVFGECDWSPGVMSQAEDRVHRIGQKRPVIVEHIVLDGSLDKLMYSVGAKKRAASREVFDTRKAA